jgi:hypothetical protein
VTAGVTVAKFVGGTPLSPCSPEAAEFSLCLYEGRVLNKITKRTQKNNKVGSVKKPNGVT